MENQDSYFQLALREADENIARIDRESARIQTELRRLSTEKVILLGTRKALLIQLGELVPEKASDEEGTSSVSKNAFKGLGSAAAARKYLQEVGQAQTHQQVVDALVKGNAKSGSKRPSDSIRTSMQRRPEWFRWVKRKGSPGCWELVEWPETSDSSAEERAQTAAIVPALALVGQPQLSA